jgi:hypothetical protein
MHHLDMSRVLLDAQALNKTLGVYNNNNNNNIAFCPKQVGKQDARGLFQVNRE